MANPVQGGAQVIAQQSGGRKTALALVLAIAAAELVLSGRMQAMWKALWGPMQPLSRGNGGPSAPVNNANNPNTVGGNDNPNLPPGVFTT